jgi:hypothetical protein
VRTHRWSGVNIEGLVHLKRWMDTMKERPACRRGVEIPAKVDSVLRDDAATQAFVDKARQSLQR